MYNIRYSIIGGYAVNLLIVGSRSIKEYDLKEYVPKGTTMIITGGADGIDTLAEKLADEMRLSKLIMRPQYNLYGRAAPLKRNEKMVELCDAALIIWDGKSKGTKYTAEYAKKLGKSVILVIESI
jgi:predicted Rossmann fold nucleotide-binding protein DprA/Smf involved in DNA uptake